MAKIILITEPRQYNELKLETLSAFANGEWLRPSLVAEQLDFSPRRSAWTYLRRLCRFGLLEDHFVGKGTLQYRITDEGTARLKWLRSKGD